LGAPRSSRKAVAEGQQLAVGRIERGYSDTREGSRIQLYTCCRIGSKVKIKENRFMPEHKLPHIEKAPDSEGTGDTCLFMALPFQEKSGGTTGLRNSNTLGCGSEQSELQSEQSSSWPETPQNQPATLEKVEKPVSSKSPKPYQREDSQSVTFNLTIVSDSSGCQQKPLHIVWPHRW
ncbi:Glycosyltransferase-like domain-containing protein 1, partial [Varanus komodoensis]